jgi:sugar O-acyltransferase (sialic acid O-acetyltransferase NeuD family)
METLTTDQSAEWLAVLAEMKAYDFYYLPSYHKLAEMQGEGVGELFVHRDGKYVIAIPLLLRPVSAIQGLERVENGLIDATTVYGYTGPIASHEEIPNSVLIDFHSSLRQKLLSMNVVSLFARLHPLFNQSALLSGLGVIVNNGTTVSIDLSLPEQMQLAQYRKDHRHGIRKLRDMGATCGIDVELKHLDAFVELYSRNMERVGAKAEYFFPRSYFNKLITTTEAMVKLFVSTIEGELACAAIFLKCGVIIQYHLSATSEKYLKYAPIKILLDTVRHWGVEQGATTFHLGGGVGSSADSLFLFKAGFSQARHEFFTWRWILSESEYRKLTSSRTGTSEIDVNQSVFSDFFPAYRAPQLARSVGTNLVPEANPLRSDGDPSPAIVPAKVSIVEKSADIHPVVEPDHLKNQGAEVQPRAEGEKKNVRVLVLGGGGHARVVADAILTRSAKYGGMELVGFLDDDPTMRHLHILGKPVLGTISDIKRIPHEVVVIGIGDNEDRQKLFEDLSKQGEKFITVIHPHATVARDVKMGRGTVVFGGVVVNTGAKIGDNVILNTGCTVGHDCTVGPHAHICPGAHLGGTVLVRKGAFVGIGSAIIQGKTIGEWAIVGGGSTVTKDVPPRTTVVGVPAQVMKKQPADAKKEVSSLSAIRLDSKDE